jgi:NAD+ kinase
MEDALNEIVVHSRNHRVVDIELLVGRRRFAFYADGVMFSTPTGSSAYCYSCGGRELPKHARKYEIVAIAPYRRAFTYAIVPDSVTASAVVKSNNADLISDGQFIHHLKAGSIIKVWKSSRAIELVKA